MSNIEISRLQLAHEHQAMKERIATANEKRYEALIAKADKEQD